MEYSYLFYGYYNNTLMAESNFSYNIPLAYLLTAAFYFAFCLICIIARSVSEQTIELSVILYVCVCLAVMVRVKQNAIKKPESRV